MSSTIQMHINPADKMRLMNMMILFPKETYRGLGRAGAAVRGKLRKIMRSGGGEGVGTFAPMAEVTTQMNGKHKLGGVLAKSSAIQMYKNGKGAMTIGFLSALQPWARAFQEDESRELTEGEKRRFQRFGVKTPPETYNRPERAVIEPFTRTYQREFVSWAIRNTEKILEKAKR